MGEMADDLIDAGMMQEYPFGPRRYSFFNSYNRSSRSRRSRRPQSRRKPVLPPVPAIYPEMTHEAFDRWYKRTDWKGCSIYEVASMAWEWVKEQYEIKDNVTQLGNDHFTWWHDENAESWYGTMTMYGITQLVWLEAVKRCKAHLGIV